jgi:hypothetical protein
MEFDKIIFYNHFNNGDLHISRSFVNQIVSKIKQQNPTIEFAYSHRNDPSVLRDLPGVQFDAVTVNSKNHMSAYDLQNRILSINTWYGADHQRHLNNNSITFDCLYSVFEEVCQKKLNLSLADVSPTEFFPKVDYKQYQIEKVQRFIQGSRTTSNPLILVANGPAKSGQAANFNFSSIVLKLAQKYQGLAFILTDKVNEPEVSHHNIFYSSDLIGKQGSDLNENSFLSTACDFVIGRSSGVFSFSLVQENLFHRDCTYLSFSNLSFPGGKYWIGSRFKDKITYQAQVLNFEIFNPIDVSNIIEYHLMAKYGT